MKDTIFGFAVLFYTLALPFIGAALLNAAPQLKAKFAKLKKDTTIYRR